VNDLSIPRIIHGLTIEQYHGGPGISKSGLDDISRSPAHYYALHLDPRRPPEKERAGQLEGNLAHCAVLEPGEFTRRYITLPPDAPPRPTDAMRNAKAPSESSVARVAWWDAFGAAAAGKQIISSEQYEVAMRQAESIRRLPEISAALAIGEPEASVYWTDPDTGVLCRCRPDWAHPVGETGVILIDVKTFSSASPEEFRRQVARKRYHVQDAWYRDGYQVASGREVLAFIFATVETEWPYAASALCIDADGVQQGRRDYRRDVNRYAKCMGANEWPGYEGIAEVSLPRWALED